jgi:TatD DNase family protein
MDKNIVLCGVGGQGTVLASKLIAAAAMEKSLSVMSAETIGMAQRGGSVFSHLRIGEEIYSPMIARGTADLILGFEPGETVRMLEYLKHPKCVACGEFGLDYHYDPESRPRQIALFERHLQLALTSGKTIVLHLREADDDALAVLRGADIRNKNIHVHCFTGTPGFAEALLALDANIYIGFTGIITFKNAQNVRDAAAIVPDSRMLLETDSPYMAPIPYRGKPCHSGYIPYIANKLAEVKGKPVEEIYRQVRENTRRCYGI